MEAKAVFVALVAVAVQGQYGGLTHNSGRVQRAGGRAGLFPVLHPELLDVATGGRHAPTVVRQRRCPERGASAAQGRTVASGRPTRWSRWRPRTTRSLSCVEVSGGPLLGRSTDGLEGWAQ